MSKKWLLLIPILVVVIVAGWFLKGKLLGGNKDIVVPMTEKTRALTAWQLIWRTCKH